MAKWCEAIADQLLLLLLRQHVISLRFRMLGQTSSASSSSSNSSSSSSGSGLYSPALARHAASPSLTSEEGKGVRRYTHKRYSGLAPIAGRMEVPAAAESPAAAFLSILHRALC